ncbi:hypothetical protein [Phenylobacterium sp.]|uniref:hypothetical protein n=1 Tax=Phenylobacterium sp. TaxID=1871053 RepID=UPI0026194D88|nr:hypothetical protein [Phenylobacterium sp.]
MKTLIIALAVTALAGAAAAQPYGDHRDNPGDHRDAAVVDRDHDHMDHHMRHHRHRVCVWRHHHRVCRWRGDFDHR